MWLLHICMCGGSGVLRSRCAPGHAFVGGLRSCYSHGQALGQWAVVRVSCEPRPPNHRNTGSLLFHADETHSQETLAEMYKRWGFTPPSEEQKALDLAGAGIGHDAEERGASGAAPGAKLEAAFDADESEGGAGHRAAEGARSPPYWGGGGDKGAMPGHGHKAANTKGVGKSKFVARFYAGTIVFNSIQCT